MFPYFLLLLIVMIAAGFIGGLVNYLIGFSSDSPDSNDSPDPKNKPSTTEPHWWLDRMFYTSIVLGIAASLVVPVFLRIVAIGVDETLLANFLFNIGADNTPEDKVKAYVSLTTIFGFCVLAAISSRSFLIGLSAKLLNQVKDEVQNVKQGMNEVNHDLKDISQKAKGFKTEFDTRVADLAPENSDEAEDSTDAEDNDSKNPTTDFNEGPVTVTSLTDLDQAILAALAAKPNTRRSVKGILEDLVGADPNPDFQTVRKQLHKLSAAGFVQELQRRDPTKKNPVWKLATKGWATVKLN